MLRLNPHSIVLADIDAFEAPVDFLPMGSPYWARDAHGHIETRMTDTGLRARLAFDSKVYQEHLQRQIAIVMATHVVDGVLLRHFGADSPDRVALVQAVRRGVGETAIIALDAGIRPPELSAPYVNGAFAVDDGVGKPIWAHFASLCEWTAEHMRKPTFTVLEAVAATGRTHLYDMRMMTTLALVSRNAYATYGDASGHDWYDFWTPVLGRPLRPAVLRDGMFRREFENGAVIFNPPTNGPVTVTFPLVSKSLAKSLTGQLFSVQRGDGDIIVYKTGSGHPPL